MIHKFKWARFFMYLICGLVLLCGWGYVNYTNYVQVEQAVTAKVAVNKDIIDGAVQEIEVEQQTLRQVQSVYEPSVVEDMVSRSPASSTHIKSATQPVPNAIVDILQERIDKLEADKQGYLQDKSTLKKEIEDVISLLKLNPKNPFINMVILPLLGYSGKKLLDLIFKRLERKFIK